MATQYSLIAEIDGRHIEKKCAYNISEDHFYRLLEILNSLRAYEAGPLFEKKPWWHWALSAVLVIVVGGLIIYGVINHPPIPKGLPFCDEVPDFDAKGCRICCQNRPLP